MKRFSQHKYDERKRQEYLHQTEEEETCRRAHAENRKWKQEYLDRKQESGEDAREYYTAGQERVMVTSIFYKQEEPGGI